MDHVLSTHVCIQHRLTTVWLDRIWDAGIPAVEIFCARHHLDYRDRAQINELGHWFRDSQLKLHSLHMPMYSDDQWGRSGPNATISITELSKPRRQEMVDEIKRALEAAEVIPYRYAVQHLGVGGEEFDLRKWDAAFTALEELNLFAGQRGVEILLENIPNALSSGERLMGFLEMTHLRNGFCFDSGHAHIMSGIEHEWEIMRDRVKSTHIHDNDGKNDNHRYPFLGEDGNVNWRKTMGLLRERPGQYPLLLELREVPGIPKSIEAAAEVFRRLEELPSAEEERESRR
ncbi:sugar phosphate isomerase/epimerase family protein [Bryobacter aggregatus]|uniref:sugar phosphate isomerase/epimerase family protein n=1 Tax=Bryobacter aggregatus TaxID=360054 RepID=UPI0004E1D191|nr:sugar phosphate isomerase/epimerase family protein [Bryobacter aggregatus]